MINDHKLFKVLSKLIKFGFKGGDGEFKSVDGQGVNWFKNRASGFSVFNKSNLKASVKYLLQNCYFKLVNRIFR